MQYVWLGVMVLAIIIEATTSTLVSIWFIPSAIISLILALCKVDLWIQITVFVVVSALLLICTRKFVEKLLKKNKTEHTNLDAVIGQSAVVTERISNVEETGAVKIMGKEWTARSVDDSVFEIGDVVTVDEIRGVKLICK